jgi:hypothetical protein
MNVSVAEIERVVREVIAGLGAAPPKVEATKPEAESKRPPVSAPRQSMTDNQPSTLTLSSRVVTMNDIADHLGTMRRLVVSRKAIVTPAVVDVLIRRGIALEQTDAKEDKPATTRLSFASMGVEFDPTALNGVLAREGFRTDYAAFDCLIAATDRMAEDVLQPDTLGVLLTRHVATGLCLANRHSGVRAAADVSAIAAIGANVLLIDPRELSFFRLKQIVTDFGRGGVPACPKSLSERLG